MTIDNGLLTMIVVCNRTCKEKIADIFMLSNYNSIL